MKKKTSSNRTLVGGILLTFFALGLLLLLGFFLWQKYARPSSLADILPAEETLFFGELQLGSDATALGKIFGSDVRAEIAGLDSLGLAHPTDLLALARNHIGVAFLGATIDPQNFALIFDVADRDAALALLEREVAAGETLASQNFLGQKIYTFPRSRPLAFTFARGNLILAADSTILQKIVTAISAPEKRVARSEAFRAVAAKFNPRENFVFCSPRFLNEFFASRFVGLQKAFAVPFLDLWTAGGATFSVDGGKLKIEARLILKNSAVKTAPFLAVGNLDKEIFNLWGEETKLFFANKNLASQVENFLTASAAQNSPLAVITQSSIKNFLQTWFGESFTELTLVPLFASSSALGLTTSGGAVAVFTGDQTALFEKLKTANGKIAAVEKTVELPDTTAGHELAAEGSAPSATEEFFASQKIETLHFPQSDLSFMQLDNLAIFATEKAALEKMVARFMSEEKFLPDELPASGNIFYARLDTAVNPFLQPFHFMLAAVNFESDGAEIDFSFAQ